MLIYIDQNILSVQAQSSEVLSLPGHQVAYSTVHFDEIARSADPAPYVHALDRLHAKHIRPIMSNGLPQDDVEVVAQSASTIFEEYLEERKRVPINVAEVQSFLAWLNGGNVNGDIADMPQRIRQYFADAVRAGAPKLPIEFIDTLARKIEKEFEPVVSKALQVGNDYQANWERLGAPQTGFSQIAGADQLMQIWKVVQERVQDQAPEAYFGFKWKDGDQLSEAPRVLGIVACCGVLDALGFKAEKKRRKARKQANVQSDAQHIAMASFTDVFFTKDERLFHRAKAIYDFRSINTTSVYLDKFNEPSW